MLTNENKKASFNLFILLTFFKNFCKGLIILVYFACRSRWITVVVPHFFLSSGSTAYCWMSTRNRSFTYWLLNVVTSQEVFQLKVQLEIQWLRGNEFVKLLVTQRYIIECMRRRSSWYYGRVLTCADVVNHQCSSYIYVLLNWFSPVISIQHIRCPRCWWFAFKVLQWTYWGRSTIIWGVHTSAACFCWHFNVLVVVFYFCIIWTFIYWL